MTRFKKTILFLHRWLGFITGLVVLIVSVTGCLFCFQDEIQDALCDYRKVEIQNKPFVAPSILKSTALKQHPGAAINYIYYFGKDRPAEALVSHPKEGFRYVFMNPSTGAITHTEDPSKNFFVIVEFIHLYLLLPPKIGQPLVGISVIIFVAIMITGIILWWPKRKSDRKRSFTIKWNGRWRRVNYDLHNVLGFYATGITIILAITGLSIAFDWVTEHIYKTANLGGNYSAEKSMAKSDSLQKVVAGQPAPDQALIIAQQRSPKAQMFLIYMNDAKSGTVEVTAYATALHFYKSDIYSFDKYSGKLLKTLTHARKSPGMKLNSMNYDIHVGQILGLTGKIAAFLASLICASLPVTGLIIWLGKRKKTKKSKPRQVVHRRLEKQLAR